MPSTQLKTRLPKPWDANSARGSSVTLDSKKDRERVDTRYMALGEEVSIYGYEGQFSPCVLCVTFK